MLRILLFAVSLFFIIGCAPKPVAPYNDYRNPRFSPDGKQIVFDVANSSFYERVRIHLYNLETKELISYIPPHGQSFEHAYFSPDGKKLVFVTTPVGNRDDNVYNQRNEIFLNSQIATMNIDGSDMQVYTSIKGYKGMPAFSHKGDKVIFAMSEHMRDSGHTLASGFELYELDLKSKQVGLFLGKKFRFYQMGLSTYFNDDERVLLNADCPMEKLHDGYTPSDYVKDTNSSNVYVVKRGDLDIEMPRFRRFDYSTSPTMDKDEKIYFYGAHERDGGGLRAPTGDCEFTSWIWPRIIRSKPIISLGNFYVSHNGRFVIAAFDLKGDSALMLLDIKSKEWKEIVLPKTAKEIIVK